MTCLATKCLCFMARLRGTLSWLDMRDLLASAQLHGLVASHCMRGHRLRGSAAWHACVAGTATLYSRGLLGSARELLQTCASPRMYEHCVMEHLAGTLPLSRYPKSSCDLICAGICWDLKRVLQTCDRLACMSIALWSTLMGLFV